MFKLVGRSILGGERKGKGGAAVRGTDTVCVVRRWREEEGRVYVCR